MVLTMALTKDNALSISWHDSNWIPHLNPTNVMHYFCERSNPFYDHTCNNEIIKMQRLNQDQLNNLTGIEYILLHVQEPILYVVRKQHRHSPQQTTPIADYYILAGVVYQAPDLSSVINSRLLNTLFNLETAFEEAQSYSRYHPSKGYWWEFKDQEEPEAPEAKDKNKKKEEPSSVFQRQRVDLLLGELSKKFPPKFIQPTQPEPKEEVPKTEVKQEIKQEKPDDKQTNTVKPPPEKKPKTIR